MKVTKVKCDICGLEISKSNYSKHLRRHEKHPESFVPSRYKVTGDSLECKFCGKLCKNKNSLTNHQRLCKKNPDRQLTTYEKGIDPFLKVRTEGCVNSNEGEEVKDENHTRLCPHCKRWFKPSQIGGHVVRCSKVHNESRKVMYAGCILDVTVEELEEYRRTHLNCEICGKTIEEAVVTKGKYAPKKLALDHDHITGRFRGVLCQVCNRQLGWYEKNRDAVNAYLDR